MAEPAPVHRSTVTVAAGAGGVENVYMRILAKLERLCPHVRVAHDVVSPVSMMCAVVSPDGITSLHVKSVVRWMGRACRRYPCVDPMSMALVDSYLEQHADFLSYLFSGEQKDLVDISNDLAHRFRVRDTVRGVLSDLSPWLGDFDAPSVADTAWVCTFRWMVTSGLFTCILDTDTDDTLEQMKGYMDSYDSHER